MHAIDIDTAPARTAEPVRPLAQAATTLRNTTGYRWGVVAVLLGVTRIEVLRAIAQRDLDEQAYMTCIGRGIDPNNSVWYRTEARNAPVSRG